MQDTTGTYRVQTESENEKKFTLTIDKGEIRLADGSTVNLVRESSNPNVVTVLHNNRRIEALIKPSIKGSVEVSMFGYRSTLKIEDTKDDALRSILQEAAASTQQRAKVVAPMPGLLKQIFVTNGQSVRKGEKLFVLEAMKMENIIKASASGTISDVHSSEGSAVEKGTLLCAIEAAPLTA